MPKPPLSHAIMLRTGAAIRPPCTIDVMKFRVAKFWSSTAGLGTGGQEVKLPHLPLLQERSAAHLRATPDDFDDRLRFDPHRSVMDANAPVSPFT